MICPFFCSEDGSGDCVVDGGSAMQICDGAERKSLSWSGWRRVIASLRIGKLVKRIENT